MSSKQIEEATAAYEAQRAEVSKKKSPSLFERTIDVLGLEKARDKLQALERSKTITVIELVERGPRYFARELDEIFARDGGLPVSQRHVLFVADDSVPHRSWWTMVPNVDTRTGGMCHSVEASRFLIDHGEPAWFKEHDEARVVAIVDGKVRLFVRDAGVWFVGDDYAAKVAAKEAADKAAQEAAWKQRLAEQEAEQAKQKLLDDQRQREFEQRLSDREAAREIEDAAREKELAIAEAQRQANLSNLAADPMTIITLADAMGFVRADGRMFPLLSERDLMSCTRGVAISQRAAALFDGAYDTIALVVRESDARERLLAAVTSASEGRCRAVVRVNLGPPYGRKCELELVAFNDGARTVLATPDERVPLAWRGI